MHLLREFRQFERDCTLIENLIDAGIKARTSNHLHFETYLSHAIIRLHDAWAFRCRSIVLMSAKGNVYTCGGRVIPGAASLALGGRPVDYLKAKWGKKQMPNSWEPNWYIPSEAIRAAKLLAVANEAEITNGLGASVAPDRVRVVRNVVAHTLPATYSKMRQLQNSLGWRGRQSPAEFVVSRVGGVGAPYIYDWIADLKVSLRAAIA